MKKLSNNLRSIELAWIFLNRNRHRVISGKFVNHKGRNRHFTSPEQLEEERKSEESKKWRKKKNPEGSGSDDSDEEESGSAENSDASESESEEEQKKSGAHGLIEIENPNRVQRKAVVKVSNLDTEVAASTSASSSSQLAEPLSRRVSFMLDAISESERDALPF